MEYAAHADNTWGLLHRLADAQTGWCTDWLVHRLAGSSKATDCLTFIGTMPWHMVDTLCNSSQWLAGCLHSLSQLSLQQLQLNITQLSH